MRSHLSVDGFFITGTFLRVLILDYDEYNLSLEASNNKADKCCKNRKWRHEYMTLLMRDKANQKIGMEIERQKIIIRMIEQELTNNQITLLCDTSEEEIENCRKAK